MYMYMFSIFVLPTPAQLSYPPTPAGNVRFFWEFFVYFYLHKTMHLQKTMYLQKTMPLHDYPLHDWQTTQQSFLKKWR